MQTQTAIRSDAIHHPAMRVRHIPTVTNTVPGPGLDRPIKATPLEQTMQLMGAAMSYPRNAEIFGENESADYLYKVISGSVRTYKILSDGRRQIGGFYLPGDIFGLEYANQHTLSAEAVSDTKVLVVKRSTLTALAARDAAIGKELFTFTGRELQRVQDRVMLLIKSAQERVASFLLEMADRSP